MNSLSLFEIHITVLGNKVSVCNHLCIHHTLGTMFKLHQCPEYTCHYFRINIPIGHHMQRNTVTIAMLFLRDMCILENIC